MSNQTNIFAAALDWRLIGFIPDAGTERADWFADWLFYTAGLLTDDDLTAKYGRDARLIAADVEYSLELRKLCEDLLAADRIRKIPVTEAAICKLIDRHAEYLREKVVA